MRTGTRKTKMLEENQTPLLSELSAIPGKTSGEPAITSLYRRYSGPLRYYLCKHITEDAEWIEEVVQDTFLDVWKQPDRFRGEAAFKNWLISIARHKAIDAIRKRKVESEPLDSYTDVLVADYPMIIDQIQNEQVVQALACCLDKMMSKGKLSAEHREVLQLIYVEDLDISDAARIIGCPQNTVKTRLLYARRQIKETFRREIA